MENINIDTTFFTQYPELRVTLLSEKRDCKFFVQIFGLAKDEKDSYFPIQELAAFSFSTKDKGKGFIEQLAEFTGLKMLFICEIHDLLENNFYCKPFWDGCERHPNKKARNLNSVYSFFLILIVLQSLHTKSISITYSPVIQFAMIIIHHHSSFSMKYYYWSHFSIKVFASFLRVL
jgi:hypothetical protein